ncbi:MAG: Eco57I restriction-modification methylase domain-containing protein [Planctomycetota bacterium]|jgi:hypothetical protein
MNFNSPYNRSGYVEFFRNQFLPEDFEASEESISLSFSPQYTQQVTKIGQSRSLDLNVYELQHSSENDPRVSLSKESFRLLAEYGQKRALVLFVSKTSENYRLSLVTIDLKWEEGKRPTKEYSNPRRYSFFLGSDAKIHTPQEYLVKPGRVIDLEDLKNRFSIEVVNKDFYTQIAILFTKLTGGKRKIGSKSLDIKKGMLAFPSPDETKRKKFAVRLIGRLVFCWFLKKKESTQGKALLPEDLLCSNAIGKTKGLGDYYHRILEPLFFEVLNTPMAERPKSFSSEPWSIIPFLNGGLFTPHEDDYYELSDPGVSKYLNTLKVPDKWLQYLLGIFETYNFTIDENTPVDVELSIEPEMLGRIFENLLAEINPETGETARKATGSYYTPRPIVEYMVDESLKQYLLTKTKMPEEKLPALLSYTDDELELSEEEKESVLDALDAIKIIDPACGSGAFPMGILQKLLLILQKIDPDSQKWLSRILAKIENAAVRKELELKLKNAGLNYIHKLGVIQSSIYGVDIQPIAVEISKLRCFLSLIVDESIDDAKTNRGIEPLPNLEFKFVCSNTLIGLPKKASGKTIKSRSKYGPKGYKDQNLMFEASDRIKELKELREKYLRSYGKEKKQIEERFRKVQDKMFEHALNWGGKETQTLKLSQWNPFSDEPCRWFDHEWMFGIVDGFDIAIGNPPYVDSEHMTRIMPGQREIIGDLFITAKGNWDLYIPFWEATFNLLSKDGCASLITPNKWFAIKYGKILRGYLCRFLCQIANCDYINVFEAGNSPVIAFVRKGSANKNILIDRFNESYLIDKQVKAKRSILDFDNWGMLLSRHTKLVLKIVNSEKKIEDYYVAENPFTVSEAYEVKKILLDLDKITSTSKEHFRFINTGTIDKYINLWGHKLTTYIKTKYLQPIILKKDFLAKFPKRYKQMDSEKIVISGMRHFECLLDTKANLIAGKSTIILKPKSQISLKVILGILNSKLITFYIKEAYGVLGINGGINFTAGIVENLPIPRLEEIKIRRIGALADKILRITNDSDYLDNPSKQAKVHKLEKQIDQMVYELYGLTEEEIAIVENSGN